MADDEKRVLVSSRDANRRSDLYSNPNAPEFYADGVGAANMGSAIARVSFFTTYDIVPSDNPHDPGAVEKRRVAFNVILPAASLIEFAAGMLANAVLNREIIAHGNNAVLDSIDAAMAAIRAQDKPKS